MGQPTWREIKKLKVPDEKANTWTPALEYVTPGKLYRINVASDQKWTPESGTDCKADGDPSLTRSEDLVIKTSAVGALIAKISGSTADVTPDNSKVILFSAGRHCVFSISDPAKTGSLYLGINDTPKSQGKVEGQVEVTIFESL